MCRIKINKPVRLNPTRIKFITGFTLIEVLITLSLIALLFGIAISDIKGFVSNSEITRARDEISYAIQRTRNEAISRNENVILCKSENFAKCANNGDYEQGWIIFVDNDKDKKVDSGEEILHTYNTDYNQVSIVGNSNFKNRMTFLPTGDSTSFGRLVICNKKRLKTSEVIFINATGKPRIAPDNNKNTIPEDNNNKDIDSCLTDTTILD